MSILLAVRLASCCSRLTSQPQQRPPASQGPPESTLGIDVLARIPGDDALFNLHLMWVIIVGPIRLLIRVIGLLILVVATTGLGSVPSLWRRIIIGLVSIGCMVARSLIPGFLMVFDTYPLPFPRVSFSWIVPY